MLFKPARYFLSPGCRFVKGAARSAIYDLNNDSVYSLNGDATRLLETALGRRRITGSVSLEYLEKLCGMNLLTRCAPAPAPADADAAPRLNYAWLEITGRCNCACLHCYGAFGQPAPEQREPELTAEEWEDVIRAVRRYGCRSIQLIGGEPLMSPWFLRLLRFAKAEGMTRIDVFTNGYFLDEKVTAGLAETGASVRVSLYGFDEHSHDGITQRKGSFAALDKALRLLRDAQIPTTIAVVLMRENQHALRQIISYIESVGHRYTGYDTIRTNIWGGQQEHAVTDTEILKPRFMTAASFHTSAEAFQTNRQWNSCWFGKLAVTAAGDVIPCIFARNLTCGNIKTDSSHTIQERLLAYWRVTKDQVEVCRDCEYRYACDDCRPLSMGANSPLLSKYPRCCYNPYLGQWDNSLLAAAVPVASIDD